MKIHYWEQGLYKVILISSFFFTLSFTEGIDNCMHSLALLTFYHPGQEQYRSPYKSMSAPRSQVSLLHLRSRENDTFSQVD